MIGAVTVATSALTAIRSIRAIHSIEAPVPDFSHRLDGQASVLKMPALNELTMQSSPGRWIVIQLDTGEVDLCGLEPSEGARLFWEMVRLHFQAQFSGPLTADRQQAS
jgi:hypothetical protein